MGTFGKTDIGGTLDFFANGGYQDSFKAVLAEDGLVSKVTVYCKVHDVGGNVNAKTGIYGDDGGAPGGLLGESSVVAVGSSFAWVDFPFLPVLSLNTGTYHLAVIMNDNLGIAYDGGSAGDWWYVAAKYPVFNNPWGAGSSGAIEWSIYATYSLPPVGGKTLLYPYLTIP